MVIKLFANQKTAQYEPFLLNSQKLLVLETVTLGT